MNERNTGLVLILVGLAVFAIRLKHPGPYVMPGGGAFYGGLALLLLGGVLQWRSRPRALGWIALAVSPIALAPAIYSIVGESEEVISLYATDASGEAANLRLWIVDREDGPWVGMSRSKAIEHSLDGAQLEMLREGEVTCVRPVLFEDLPTAQTIHAMKVRKYTAAQLAGAVGLYPQEATSSTAALRLDPCSQAVSPVEVIHRDALLIDAHADIEIPGRESRYVGADGRSQVAPDKLRAGGVDAVVMTIAVGPGPRTAAGDREARMQADAELAAVVAMTDAPDDDLVLVRTPQGLSEAHENGQLAYILGLQNARILEGRVDAIDEFHAAGVRVFALTHMGHNDFADSSRPVFIAELGQHEPDEEHGGLSDLGRAAVMRINELGAILDISQLSRAAALEAIALSSAPVIASHSAAQALTNVSRNLSDEELDRIAENGGVVHVPPFRGYLYDSADETLDANIRRARREAGLPEDYLYPFELYWELEDEAVQQAFLQSVSELLGPGSVDMMLDHIDYIARRIGVDHVGIGTDFNHGSGGTGFMGAADAMNVTAGLLERGFTEEDIRKIWGGNFLRVFTAATEQAADNDAR